MNPFSIMADGKIEDMILNNLEEASLPSLSKPEITSSEYSKIPEISDSKTCYENIENNKYPNFDGEKIDLGEKWQEYKYSYSNEKIASGPFYEPTSRYLIINTADYVRLTNKTETQVIQLRVEEPEYSMDYKTGKLTLLKGTCYSVYREKDENNILEEGYAFDTNSSLYGTVSLKKYYDEILKNNEKVVYINYSKIKNLD